MPCVPVRCTFTCSSVSRSRLRRVGIYNEGENEFGAAFCAEGFRRASRGQFVRASQDLAMPCPRPVRDAVLIATAVLLGSCTDAALSPRHRATSPQTIRGGEPGGPAVRASLSDAVMMVRTPSAAFDALLLRMRLRHRANVSRLHLVKQNWTCHAASDTEHTAANAGLRCTG